MRPPTLALVCCLVAVLVAGPTVAATDTGLPSADAGLTSADAGPVAASAADASTDQQGDSVAPGEELSATVASHEARVSGSLEASMVEVDLAMADSDAERARRLATLSDDLQGDVAGLVEEWRSTRARYRAGEIDRATFRYRSARLAVRAGTVASLSETARAESVTLPEAVRNETHLDEENFTAVATWGLVVSANASEAVDDDALRLDEPDEAYLFGDRAYPGFDTYFDVEHLLDRSRHPEEYEDWSDHDEDWDEHNHTDFNRSEYEYDYSEHWDHEDWDYEDWVSEWEHEWEKDESENDGTDSEHDGGGSEYDGGDQEYHESE